MQLLPQDLLLLGSAVVVVSGEDNKQGQGDTYHADVVAIQKNFR